MSERRPDYRPFLLLLLGPIGWLVLLGWGSAAFLRGLAAGLTGRLDGVGDDDDDAPPRRRYRRAEG